MADTFTKEKRTEIMRRVKKDRNKSTELKLIQFFRQYKIKYWRRNYMLFGKPDFVFPNKKTAIFVDGCFWHGHNCRNTIPQDNKEYWRAKMKRNKKRDKDVTLYLQNAGWKVIRFWECELKDGRYLKKVLKRFVIN